MADDGVHRWYLRRRRNGPRFWEMSLYRSNDAPNGAVLDAADAPDDLSAAFEAWQTEVVDGHLVIRIHPEVAPGALATWYCAVPDQRDPDPAVTLVAFATDHVPVDTVIDHGAFIGLPVRNDEQVAALRWWTHDGTVDQVYVRPDLRRTQLAAKLLRAADAYHQANGWAGRLHADGRRTELGNELVGSIVSDRVASWRVRMPPMDPEEPAPGS
jgi:GNAT superfamily N-acetyltransferase